MQTTQDALWASIHSGGTHSDYLNRAYSPVSFPFTHLHKENMTSFLKKYKVVRLKDLYKSCTIGSNSLIETSPTDFLAYDPLAATFVLGKGHRSESLREYSACYSTRG